MFNYPRWHIDDREAWQYLFPAGVIAVGLLLAAPQFRRRFGRGPLVAFLIYAGTLFPALGFVNVFPMKFYFAADHFQYLASIAPIAMAVAGVCQLPWLAAGASGEQKVAAADLHRLTASTRDRWVLQGVGACGLLLVLGWLTWNQCRVYRDEETLWLDTARKNPQAFLALYNLGKGYMEDRPNRRPDLELAIRYFEKAEKAQPFAGLYANWGVALAELHSNNLPSALEKFKRAVELDDEDPGNYCNVGLAYFKMRKLDDAAGWFGEALKRDPKHPAGNLYLGETLLELHRPREALQHLRTACSYDAQDLKRLRHEATRRGWTSGLDFSTKRCDQLIRRAEEEAASK
jgi:protein O-mannosyl-transferase